MICASTLVLCSVGCGYTNRATLPNNIRTIAIPPFANVIPPEDIFTYERGLEIDITQAVIDRILFDGNLKVRKLETADSRLEGKVVQYFQEPTGYTQLDSVSEYRLFLVCDLKLIDQRTEEVIWHEPSFSGKAEYFVTGSATKPERDAVQDVIKDLAKNIVDRIVEDW